MNTIIKKYQSQIKKYQKIELDSSENEIHDKRVILRRVFTILSAYKINPSKVKNGEKAFKLFGKLRDIQIQLLKLESIDQTPELMDYHAFLKGKESELKEKVHKFCKKKELEFPAIKKKLKLNRSKVVSKSEKSLGKLIERIQSRSIDDAEDIHKIRIEFKKFRYKVEVLSYIENIDDAKLEMLKVFQDKLGDIQDYEVLINGIKKYCKKRKLETDEMTDLFEHDQNTLIENFDNQIELFIAVCKDVLILNNDVECTDNAIPEVSKTGLTVDQPDITIQPEKSAVGQVAEIIDLLVTNKAKIPEQTDTTGVADGSSPGNRDAEIVIENKPEEESDPDNRQGTKSKKKHPVDSDRVD